MICPCCKTALHVCPRCGERHESMKRRAERRYEVYTCPKGHRWHEWQNRVIDIKNR